MGQASVSAFINREEKIHLLNMLGYDTSALQTAAKTSRQLKALKQKSQGAEKLDDTEDGIPTEDATNENAVEEDNIEETDESVIKTED